MIDFENNYIVNNLNPDFDLSRYYHPNLLAENWQTIMLNSKIDNEGLIKWNDKIQLYNWMKENDIPSPPIVYYSNENHQVSDVIKSLDKNKSYVIKPSHLSLSRYIFKWKDDNVYQIVRPSMDNMALRDEVVNDDNHPLRIWPWVSSYERIDSLMKQAWNTLDDEDWPRYYSPPGVIIEEYVQTRTEFQILCIWGVIVFASINYVNHESYQTGQYNLKIDDDENIIDGVEHLPKWWEEAWDMCKPILNKSRPDQIRLDFMYHDNQVYLNEFTWNPGCDFTQRNQTLSPQAYTLLTDGYEYILGGKRPRVKLSI